MTLDLATLLHGLTALLWITVLAGLLRAAVTPPVRGRRDLYLVLQACLPPAVLVLLILYPVNLSFLLAAVAAGFLAWCIWRHGKVVSLLSSARALRASEQRREWLDYLVENAYEGVYLVDPEAMAYLDVNPSGARALQYAPEQMRHMSLSTIHPDDMPLMNERIRGVAEQGGRESFSLVAVRRDGRPIQVEITLSRVFRGDRSLVLAVGRDLTRAQENRKRIELLNRLLTISSQVNRAINRERDEQTLFQRICNIAVDDAGFAQAWIGWVGKGEITPITCAGSFCSRAMTPFALYEQEHSPLSRAVQNGYVAWENSLPTPETAESTEPGTRMEARSTAVVPILDQARPVAVLVLSSAEEGAFTETMTDLLRNLAEDLGRALQNYAGERNRRAVERRVRLLSSAVEQSADAVSMLDVNGTIRYVNPRFTELTGFQESELVGRSPRDLCYDREEAEHFEKLFQDLRQGRKWRGELRKRKKSGEEFWSMDTISPIRDPNGQIIQYVSTSEDYTALKKAQEKIQELAFYDPLTALPNRRLLQERLRTSIDQSERNGELTAVLLLDMDRFKMLNDSKGHHYGDQLLKVVGQRLKNLAGPDDTVARLGGDEFAMVVSGLEHSHEAAFSAERILEAMRDPVTIDDVVIPTTVSLGIAICPIDGRDINELLRKADIAMYHAKSQGRNNFQYFTADINQAAIEHIALEHRLKLAVEEGRLEPFFQPIWNRAGEVLGVEALARWRDDDGTLVSPALFIPIAEEAGFIEPLGELILQRACATVARLNQNRKMPLFVSVNLSAEQFKRPERLLKVLQQTLQDTGLEARHLELEITESMLIQDVERALRVMQQLGALGIRLAIDDFGTGYSSLNYLGRFPVDKLKIDKSFVDDLDQLRGTMIASAIIALGSRLGMEVVAEGVETAAQRDALHANGCEQFQGFLVAKPLPEAELERYLFNEPAA